MPKKSARKNPIVRFDSKGCIVIQDPQMIAAIRRRLKAKELAGVRLATTRSAAIIIEPVPIRQRIPLHQLGCLNTMCDCPIERKRPIRPDPAARAKLAGDKLKKPVVKQSLASKRK